MIFPPPDSQDLHIEWDDEYNDVWHLMRGDRCYATQSQWKAIVGWFYYFNRKDND